MTQFLFLLLILDGRKHKLGKKTISIRIRIRISTRTISIFFSYLFYHHLSLHMQCGEGRKTKPCFNGNWRKTFLVAVVWWLYRILFPCYYYKFSSLVFLPVVLCAKAKVNFHLIGHIIYVYEFVVCFLRLPLFYFYYCFVGHVLLLCPTEYIYIFWNFDMYFFLESKHYAEQQQQLEYEFAYRTPQTQIFCPSSRVTHPAVACKHEFHFPFQ